MRLPLLMSLARIDSGNAQRLLVECFVYRATGLNSDVKNGWSKLQPDLDPCTLFNELSEWLFPLQASPRSTLEFPPPLGDELVRVHQLYYSEWKHICLSSKCFTRPQLVSFDWGVSNRIAGSESDGMPDKRVDLSMKLQNPTCTPKKPPTTETLRLEFSNDSLTYFIGTLGTIKRQLEGLQGTE